MFFDVASHIENVLLRWTAGDVANAFILVLLIILIYGLYAAKRGLMPGLVNYVPNLLTTVGILGTFIGIVIGLIGFDIGDIDGSIGVLLDGLKTAFLTSLVGMLFAIFFKAIDSTGKLRPKQASEVVESVGPEDIHKEIKAQREAIERLSQSISGDEDSALISQIRLLRSDHNEQAKAVRQTLQEADDAQRQRFEAFQGELWNQLNSFSEMLSKSATEQVINALKEVVADFNRNLTEQFGENFKRLNAAVDELVKWQDNYRDQLKQMNDQYAQGVQAISQTASSVETITQQTQRIPETMDNLRAVMETASHQLKELERHLEAFRDMRDRAVEAVPQIRDQMDQMVNDISTATKDAGEQIMAATQQSYTQMIEGAKEFEDRVHRTNEGITNASDALANNSERVREQLDDTMKDINERVRSMLAEITSGSQDINKTLLESNKKLGTDIKEVQYQVTDSIEKMQKQLESSIQEVTQAQSREVSRAAQALEQELNKSVSRTGESVNKQLEAIDDAMNNEIERVMNAMGEALASISNRFTDDYSRLTSEMSKVVGEARKFAN